MRTSLRDRRPTRPGMARSLLGSSDMQLCRTSSICIATTILVSGCGHYRAETDPDAMSEEAHRQRADASHARASRHEAQIDSSQIRVSDTSHGGYEGIAGGDDPGSTHPTPPGQIMDPTAGHRREARRLRDLAREHRVAADALVAFEAVECVEVPRSERAACPLLGVVEAVQRIEGGVGLELSANTDVSRVAARARCHVAFGRRQGREGMSSCPLYVEGTEVELEGRRLILRAREPSAAEELHRRAARHVRDQ